VARDYRAVYDALRYKAERTDNPEEAKILSAKADAIKAAHPDAFTPDPPKIHDIITDQDFREWLDTHYKFDPYGHSSFFRPGGSASGKTYDPDRAQWEKERTPGIKYTTYYYDKKTGRLTDTPINLYTVDDEPADDPNDGTGW
jgi:hypothetical protein